MICLICNLPLSTKKDFGYHLQFKHKIKVEDYVIQHHYDGTRPTCLLCNELTRYDRTTSTFKEYCKSHAREAMKKGGKKGGQAEAWNKGKTKETDERILFQSQNVTGENNPFYGRRHTPGSIAKMRESCTLSSEEYSGRLQSRSGEFIVFTLYSEYTSRQNQYLEMECVQCGRKQKKTLQAFERGSLCRKCYPFTVSQAETEIANFIVALGFEEVEQQTREILDRTELDVYVTKKLVAFEHNGLWWHMEDGGKENFDKKAHKNKTHECLDKGIKLMHIFSDEWIEKRDIVESMIKNRLGVADRKIGARSCKVVKLKPKQAKEFFDSTHISGHAKASVYLGLEFDGEILCALSLRKPHHKKHKGKLEIARLSTAKNTVVVGGFSRLLKRAIDIARSEGATAIMSYADLRFGEGLVYAKNGFRWLSDTGLNFWYTDTNVRYDRFKFRARDGKSEAEIARENGVHRVYGCGNYLYELSLPCGTL